jgi:predicted transglutaminase-like cysteine proteinase
MDGKVTILSWSIGAAIGVALSLSSGPLQSAVAGPPSSLIASLAPSQNPAEFDVSRLPKWQRIRDWLTAHDTLDMAEPTLVEWATWAASLRGRPEVERLTSINSRVNQAFRYATDMDAWGVADYWETPAEVVSKGATDCEGFAIFKYWLARLAGIPDAELSMFVGTVTRTHQMHAVLVGKIADRGYVLDVLTPYVIDGAAFGDFQLMATVDLQAIDVFVGVLATQPAPAAMAKNN